MGRIRNELRNVAGLILKLRIIVAVQDLKISFYMQILVPRHFWLVLPHIVCSGDVTAMGTELMISLGKIPACLQPFDYSQSL